MNENSMALTKANDDEERYAFNPSLSLYSFILYYIYYYIYLLVIY